MDVDIIDKNLCCIVPVIVADPDPGSGAFLTPGSGIRNRFFPDPGSRIPEPKLIFLRANNNVQFCEIWQHKKV
jgi:hypothetical protein